MYNRFCPNLRPNGGCWEHPLFFFQIARKQRPAASPFLVHLIIHLFRICCEAFRPRSHKDRSPGHAKWPHLMKSLNTRQSYTDWMISLKLSVIPVSIKCISPNFDIGDQRSGQFCDLSIKCQWEKIEKRLFWTKTVLNTLKHHVTGKIDTLNWKIATIDPSSWPQGHFRSWKVADSFSAITFGRDKLNQWKHLRYVQNDDMDRL